MPAHIYARLYVCIYAYACVYMYEMGTLLFSYSLHFFGVHDGAGACVFQFLCSAF